MEFRLKKRDPVSMDITPLVDVVFLLLIFFMLSTTFIVSPGIRINLPQASYQPVKQERKNVRVKITEAGELMIEDSTVTPQELEKRLTNVAGLDRDTLVIIEADKDTPHKHVVEVMDSAKVSGLSRLAIATRPKR